jgi:hypothetical protein
MKLGAFLTGITILLIALPVLSADEGRIHLTLSGDWSGTAVDGTEVSYSFSKDGRMTWRVKEREFMRAFPEGLKGEYELRPGKPLCEIDIYNFNDPGFKAIRFLGILEIIDGQTFKMEGRPAHQGPRLAKFSSEAAVLRGSKK